MRSKNIIELLGLWEKLYNQKFKQVEFDLFRNEAGFNQLQILALRKNEWVSKNGLNIVFRGGSYYCS